ncbi:MAG TPA: Fic family protein, partial [Cyclobacteriaceae bacterium]|nr:Fic family protein [Cyclobacteriaceae bacterium]
MPALIRVAIAHYQFETIHPFLDGNGRIGRLLITLFLLDQKILSEPLLYLSAYFEKNKNLYYDNLTRVRTHHDMTQWIKYFLVGMADTTEQATDTLAKVLKLKTKLEHKVTNEFGRRGSSAISLLNYFFKHPIVDVREVERLTKLSYKAANDLVVAFVKAKILKETTGQSRNRLFS